MYCGSPGAVPQFGDTFEQQCQSGRSSGSAFHSVDPASVDGRHRCFPRFLSAGHVAVQERERSTSSPFDQSNRH